MLKKKMVVISYMSHQIYINNIKTWKFYQFEVVYHIIFSGGIFRLFFQLTDYIQPVYGNHGNHSFSIHRIYPDTKSRYEMDSN